MYSELLNGVRVNGRRVFASRGGQTDFVQMNAGSQLTLEGAIAGATASSLSWQKDGSPILTGGRFLIQYLGNGGSRLVINNAATSDSGLYSLSGGNSAGTVTLAGAIRVAGTKYN